MNDPGKAVFLSYASQDAVAAKRIADALRAAGVEVWFDAEGGLEHGDEWDAKIRRQIRECVLFLPIISANTQARDEGYFRIEWELAAQRALGIASGVAFILPIVIDDTREPAALVPDRFRAVQWTRLRGGELTPDVKARFLKLWSHRTGMISHEAAGRVDGTAAVHSRTSAAESIGKPGAKTYALIALGIFALVGGAGWWLLHRPPVAVSSGAPAKPAIVASETDQHIAKAYALCSQLNYSRDNLAVAEDLLRKATDLASDSAHAWGARAYVQSCYILRGWDTGDKRREDTQAFARRALALDANEVEAMLALAILYNHQRAFTQAESFAQRAIDQRVDDYRLRAALIAAVNNQGRTAEAFALAQDTMRRFPREPLSHYGVANGHRLRGEFDAALASYDAALALQPFAGALLYKTILLVTSRGDVPAARATLDQVAPADRGEDRAVGVAMWLGLVERKPARVHDAAALTARAYFEDSVTPGPKAWSVALAHQIDGKETLARQQWQAAEEVLRQRLRDHPEVGDDRARLATTLVWLGRADEAAREIAPYEASAREQPGARSAYLLAQYYAAQGNAALAAPHLARATNQHIFVTAPALRLDPQWDKLRGQPEFEALLKEPTKVPAARDWPKNPELKKAVALLDRFDAIPEDFRLAEEIAQGVLDKAPTDPEAVTAMARVQAMWLLRGWDRSSERYLKAQRVVERAVQLAPDDPEALAAVSVYLNQRGTDRTRARQLIERAIKLEPGESRLHRWRNELMWADRTVPREELIAALERTLAQFPHDALVRYDVSRHYRNVGRWEEFERELDATLAIAPVANAMVWKARAEFGLHNNLPGMKAALDRVPARVRSIERTVFGYFIYAVMSGDHAVGVDALNEMAEPWMIDFDYRGPKALPLAALLELQGKPALALIQYEVALKQLTQRQAAEPDDLFLKLDEAWALHGLGRDEEARAAIRIHNESIERPYRLSGMISWWFHPIACNLILGERGTALALVREACERGVGRETVRRFLATDPRLAAFRDDPEIQALLAEPSSSAPFDKLRATEDRDAKK
jgi:tetratricopeptide (TPR) repeat protein